MIDTDMLIEILAIQQYTQDLGYGGTPWRMLCAEDREMYRAIVREAEFAEDLYDHSGE